MSKADDKRDGRKSWARREAKREAREAMSSEATDRWRVVSQVPGRPSMGQHVRQAKNTHPLEVLVKCEATNTSVSVQAYPGADGTLLLGIFIINDDPELYRLDPRGRQPTRKRAIQVFEGEFAHSEAVDSMREVATRIVENFSRHTLGASNPDDPFYIDEAL